MDDMIRKLAEKIEADIFAAICGGYHKPPQTALRVRGRTFETVQLDDHGNVIEPCRKCGPLMLCAEHMAMIS